MADIKNQNNFVMLYFPVRGYNTSLSYATQIPLTSPIMSNCRIRDVAELRTRGGQRPGKVKAYDTQVGTDVPVIEMAQIIVTYITPE
jgi:hypothetical protein